MTMRIAVLGGGVMGETLASGFLRYVIPPDVVIVEKRAERAAELRPRALRHRGRARRGGDDRLRTSCVLVVKPQDMAALLDEVGAPRRARAAW